MPSISSLQGDWLRMLSEAQPQVGEMLARSPEEQERLGYFHTLREICQQPSTWLGTAELMRQSAGVLAPVVAGISSLIMSGSGSSDYAGDCVGMVLQKELGVTAQAIPSGTLLTDSSNALPVGRPGLMVSLARSGDSPESVGALLLMLRTEPALRHLVLTCNRQGRLATAFQGDTRVTVITLDDSTHDRSLVMTSSFTNLVLGARFLGLIQAPERYLSICGELSRTASLLLQRHFSTLAHVGKQPFHRVLFLGSGPRFAATREAALKMLEMTAGRVTTSCSTYLGLRHGPMSAVNEETLVVCFLSTEPRVRAYEVDLLQELARKQLGLLRLIVGKDVPREMVGVKDVVVPYEGGELLDENLPVLDVVVSQMLAFFRCLQEGLRPDSPSEAGVIQRVVPGFALHLPNGV